MVEMVEIPKLPECSGVGSDYRRWACAPVVLVTLRCFLSTADSRSHIFIVSFHTLYFRI